MIKAHQIGHTGETLRVATISEMVVSDDPEDILVTYSLGSCVGVSLYDPAARIGGLIHCMMPLSKVDPVKAEKNPQMFVDTGVQLLLQTLFDMGATRKNLIAKIAGCAQLLDEKGLFKIGERNHMVLRKILWKNSILVKAEDVGGSSSRSLYLVIATGQTFLKKNGVKEEL